MIRSQPVILIIEQDSTHLPGLDVQEPSLLDADGKLIVDLLCLIQPDGGRQQRRLSRSYASQHASFR